jgi:hypothetical protein
MAVLILCAFMGSALVVLAVRRALPIAIACTAGWATHHITHDPLTACATALAAFMISSTLLDRAASSQGLFVRWMARGVELAGGMLLAVCLAWSIAQALGTDQTLTQIALVSLSAAILGVLVVVSRYRTAT